MQENFSIVAAGWHGESKFPLFCEGTKTGVDAPMYRDRSKAGGQI